MLNLYLGIFIATCIITVCLQTKWAEEDTDSYIDYLELIGE